MVDFAVIGHIVIDNIIYEHGREPHVIGPTGAVILAATKLSARAVVNACKLESLFHTSFPVLLGVRY